MILLDKNLITINPVRLEINELNSEYPWQQSTQDFGEENTFNAVPSL